MTVKIYVEGGGNENKVLRGKCREAFHLFFEKAGLGGRLPRVIPCGSRRNAYEAFCDSVRQSKPGEIPMLLVDSEDPVPDGVKSWPFLRARKDDGWTKPQGVEDSQCHMMVQCMETWFLANHEKVREVFGKEFHAASLPAGAHLETIPKDRILAGLGKATARCKRPYSKGEHSFKILAALNPLEVRKSCPHVDRLFSHLEQICK